jgi:regulator of nucleoside diphosphate kinase
LLQFYDDFSGVFSMSQPSLVISSLDAQRLRHMLDGGAHDHLPGVDALSDEIDRATIVEPQQVPPDVVTMNSTVRFINDSTHQEFQLKLVYPEDIAARLPGELTKLAQDEPPVQAVSVLAPVGSALLGLTVGQSIDWQIPGGKRLHLRILQVLRQPEAEGNFLL